MIHDLLGQGRRDRTTDVLVIGAGTAGLLVATELRRRGRDVLCLESGARHQEGETHPLNEVEQSGTPYQGAEHGRFRCLGGTSTRWGGALIPFQHGDLDAGSWPVELSELSPYVTLVEELFGLEGGSYDVPQLLGAESQFIGRLAKWPTFRNRNVFKLRAQDVEAKTGPETWINATACEFEVREGECVTVIARAPDGSSLLVRPNHVILAAGAIESTRLLLLLDQQNKGLVARMSPLLGRCFHDHLSAVVADLDVLNRPALNRLVGFRFGRGGTMRNLRFELTSETDLRTRLPACFAHVGFTDETGGGFDALRDFFRLVQRGGVPTLGLFRRLMWAAPWLTQAAWWRFVEKRLLYPTDARLQLHMVIDQEASTDHRIALSHSKRDPYGQPLSRIEWGVSARDCANMMAAVESIAGAWDSSPLSRLARLVRRTEGEITADMEAGGGIYHPGGSTRMATRPAEGVVDSSLRVFAVPNVRVTATSVLPTGGGANPTMMLLLLAMRAVDAIADGRS